MRASSSSRRSRRVRRSASLGSSRSQLELDAVAVGQQLQRPLEVDALGLLHEREHVAGGLAAEAVVDLLSRVYAERRRALLVKRAQPLIARDAGSPQVGSRGHELDEVDGVAHAVSRVAGVRAIA